MSHSLSPEIEQLLFDLHFLLRSYEKSADPDVQLALGILRPSVDLVVHEASPALATEHFRKEASERTRLRIVYDGEKNK